MVATVVFDNREDGAAPLFSVIVAMFNCAKTLTRTLESLSRQTIDAADVEYVFVDDGSSDDSADIAIRWARRGRCCVVVQQENRGVASARSAALAQARGKWVTSVDPDDAVCRGYFEQAKRMDAADAEGRLAVMLPRLLSADASTGRIRDNHALTERFLAGALVVDLNAVPSAFAISSTTYMRREVLEREGLSFDTRVRPTFEDGNLILKYLCAAPTQLAGLLPDALYYYRRKAANGSLVATSWDAPERYTEEPEAGYLGAFRYARARLGFVPAWMKAAVLYDVGWYFREQRRIRSSSVAQPVSVQNRFMETTAELMAEYSIGDLEGLSVAPLNWKLRESLIVGFGVEGVCARLVARQPRRTLLGSGDVFSLLVAPGEEILAVRVLGEGMDRQVVPDAVHDLRFYGRVLAREFVFRVPEGTDFVIRLEHGALKRTDAVPERTWVPLSKQMDFVPSVYEGLNEEFEQHRMRPSMLTMGVERLWAHGLLLRDVPKREFWTQVRERLVRERSLGDRATLSALKARMRLRAGRAGHERFRDCWVFMDHWNRADDNAEHLYRYVMNHHREVNAFFLLKRGSRDWKRLKGEGFRLLDYGSPEALLALKSACVLLSSDATIASLYPGAAKIIRSFRKYHFVFLQHGVTHNDLSTWLNGSEISLVLTTSAAEHAAFCWSESSYEFDCHNLALTGFPRFDTLAALAREREGHGRTGKPFVVTVMPSWRRYLRDGADRFHGNEEQARFLASTDYFRRWQEVLVDPSLRRLAEKGLIRVRLVAHPQMAEIFAADAHYEGLEHVGGVAHSYQQEIVDADCVITDYSSTASDAALIGTPIVYFHFDEEAIERGGHMWRFGYFDYENDGFGPVCRTAVDVGRVVEDLHSRGFVRPEEYSRRVDSTFAYRDSRNCERAFSAVVRLVEGTWDGRRQLLPEGAIPQSFSLGAGR